MMYALFYRSIIYYYRNHIYWMDLWIMPIARTLDMCLWRCWCSGPIQWIYTLSTHYLHTIYTLSTQYLHSIYTVSGHVFMAMLVFRSDAMILNQPVDRWCKLHKQHPAARHYWDTCHYATMQTCRRCLTMFRVESATLIQGTYELLLFVHCTLKSVTSHKSKIKIHLQLFLDFNVEQCIVSLKWLNKLIPTKIGTCACVWIYKIENLYIIKHGIHVCMPVCRLTAWCCECCTCSDLTPAPAPTSHILISPLVHTLSWFTVAMPG